MKIRFCRTIYFLMAVNFIVSCSGDDDKSQSPTVGFTDITTNKGFSASYLWHKKFFRPVNYHGNNYIQTKAFTNAMITWSDNLLHINGSAPYSIVSSNGIDGIIQYNDGSYDLHYNLLAVENDHLKVCYTYTGIDTVITCDVTESLKWYFDLATAENNYP